MKTKIKVPYSKTAKTYDEQISLLRKRNVIITDVLKAKEYLSDIGYYRLGFYSYPFEITYPKLDNTRSHDVKKDTTIEDIVALYYFDFDLRAILNRYLSRIEVSFRSTMIYELSVKYCGNPYWFVDPTVVTDSFITKFDKEVYSHLRSKTTIKRHHDKYNDKYAPAWKSIEYMTIGNIEYLYNNLLLDKDKELISRTYREPAYSTFGSYISTIREVRNACAHGNVIFGLKMATGIKTGVACPSLAGDERHTLKGALRVITFILGNISQNRANDMWKELDVATRRLYSKVPSIRPIIEQCTGIIVPVEKDNLLKRLFKRFF